MTHCFAKTTMTEDPDLPEAFDFEDQTKTQTKLPDSELRMSMGILYQSEGRLLHGLNRYNLVVGIKLPEIDLQLNVDRPPNDINDFINHCRQLTSIPMLVNLCEQIWPLYHNFRNQELKHQHTIQQIMCRDLPAMLSTYKPSDSLCKITLPDYDNDIDAMDTYIMMDKIGNSIRNLKTKALTNNTRYSLQDNNKTVLPTSSPTNRQSRQRYSLPTKRVRYVPHPLPDTRNSTHRNKRFISTLVSLAYDGFKTYIQHKQNKKLFKGIKLLQKRQNVLENRIQTVHDDMLAIAKATLHDINQVKEDLHITKTRIAHIASSILAVEDKVREWKETTTDNTATIIYLTAIVGHFLPEIERCMSYYEYLIHHLDELTAAIDDLSNGQLSPSVIKPGLLQDLISQVESKINNQFPQYTLALSIAEMYYNIPVVKFMSMHNMLGIQIPLWMQQHLQTPLNLYAIRTVPVPYHINSELSNSQDNTNTQQSYTWLHPKHELIALSYSTYIPLDKVQIQNCLKFGNFFFCEQTLLTQHSTGHTCECYIL